MHVLASTRQMAAFQVLTTLITDVPAIDITDFERSWPATGLRRHDCPLAVSEMVHSQLLTRREDSGHSYLELTDAGLAAYHASEDSLVRQVNDGLILLRARWRRDWLQLLGQKQGQRRLGDHPRVDAKLASSRASPQYLQSDYRSQA